MPVRSRRRALGAPLALALCAPATAAELYLAGDRGIGSQRGDGVGTNDLVAISNEAHESTTSLAFSFWRMPLLGAE